MKGCKTGLCLGVYNRKMYEKDGKRKIITLCGSTNFKKEYLEINKFLTLGGAVVLSAGVFREDIPNIEDFMEKLMDIHRKKIDMSDAIFVINKDGYIGDHTREEITYAQEQGKELMFLEEFDR
jgi:hypothetical protein